MGLATSATVAAFADLICADPQWVREEFDALVSASFSQPPSWPPAPPWAAPRRPWYPPSEPWLPPVQAAPAFAGAAPGPCRQRSPPV